MTLGEFLIQVAPWAVGYLGIGATIGVLFMRQDIKDDYLKDPHRSIDYSDVGFGIGVCTVFWGLLLAAAVIVGPPYLVAKGLAPAAKWLVTPAVVRKGIK